MAIVCYEGNETQLWTIGSLSIKLSLQRTDNDAVHGRAPQRHSLLYIYARLFMY